MSQNIIYHVSEVEAKKDTYQSFDNLDFIINCGEGRSLVPNSVEIIGELQVRDNASRSTNNHIFFDPITGIHSFVDSIQTQFIDGPAVGSKENIQNYARFVSMLEQSTKAPESAYSGSMVAELKSNSEQATVAYSKGRNAQGTGGAALIKDQDFSFKPVCMLNRMSGDPLPFEKSGQIRLTVNLATNASALMGGQFSNSQDDYQWRNVRVNYVSVQTKNGKNAQSFRTVYNVKSSVQSNFANVQMSVPAVCRSCSVSFQRQSEEQQTPHSNYKCDRPRNLEEVQFLFNDSTSQYISYVISDKTEMLERYIESFRDTEDNMLSGSRYNSQRAFGVGLSFAGYTDLSQQKFAVQIKSGATSQQSYNMYLYFHSLLQM